MDDVLKFERWLIDGECDDSDITLLMHPNYIDVRKRSGIFVGTAAIRYNRNLIVADTARLSIPALRQAAINQSFKVHTVKQADMVVGRSCFTRQPTISVDMIPRILPFLELTPHRSDDMITVARVKNALEHRGEMTHALVYDQSVSKMYRSAEEAVLAFLSKGKGGRLVEL